MKKLFNLSFIYLFSGLFMGAFYREFTKFLDYTDQTTLSVVHTHFLALGFLLNIVLFMLSYQFDLSSCKSFGKGVVIFNIGVITAITFMIVRGVTQVLHIELGGMTHAISGMAGLGHILLTVGIVWVYIVIRKKVTLKISQ